MSSRHLKRLQTELKSMESECREDSLISLKEYPSDLLSWRVRILGAPSTIYADESFTLRFQFTEDYPIEAPEVVFEVPAPINEHVYSNGHICLSILYDQWSPAMTAIIICRSIISMLSSADHKQRPPDDQMYIDRCRGGPKDTCWDFHGKSQHPLKFMANDASLDEC